VSLKREENESQSTTRMSCERYGLLVVPLGKKLSRQPEYELRDRRQVTNQASE